MEKRNIGSGALTLLLVGSLTAGCGSPEATTGVYLTVHFAGRQVDQLGFSLRSPSGAALDAMRPSTITPGTWLDSPQSVVIYLPDAMAGETVTCEVRGVAMGSAVPARGQTDAVLRLHQLIAAELTLTDSGTTPVTTPEPPAPPPATMPPVMPPKCNKSECDKKQCEGNSGPGSGPDPGAGSNDCCCD